MDTFLVPPIGALQPLDLSADTSPAPRGANRSRRGLRGKRSVGAILAVATASGSCLQTQQACHCYEMIRTEYSRLVPLRDRR
jgi:hypothetical protein